MESGTSRGGCRVGGGVPVFLSHGLPSSQDVHQHLGVVKDTMLFREY